MSRRTRLQEAPLVARNQKLVSREHNMDAESFCFDFVDADGLMEQDVPAVAAS